MNELFSYWYCREQSLIDRAIDVSRYLVKLNSVIAIDEWQTTLDQVIQVKDSENAIHTLLNHFKKEVKRHYKVKEVDDSFAEDIGSVLTLKSISPHHNIKLKFIIGGCHSNIPNSLIVQGLKGEARIVKSCFAIGIEHFKVDWATVTDFEFIDRVTKQSSDEFWIGWMLYLSNKVQSNLEGLNCSIEELNTGKLITVTDAEFDPSDPLHVKKAIDVADYFRTNNISRNTFYITSPQDI
jgi:hypothetical protein